MCLSLVRWHGNEAQGQRSQVRSSVVVAVVVANTVFYPDEITNNLSIFQMHTSEWNRRCTKRAHMGKRTREGVCDGNTLQLSTIYPINNIIYYDAKYAFIIILYEQLGAQTHTHQIRYLF